MYRYQMHVLLHSDTEISNLTNDKGMGKYALTFTMLQVSLARERVLNGAKRWSRRRGLGNSLIESALGGSSIFRTGWLVQW